MIDVDFYITNHRNNTVALPVAPDEIKITDENGMVTNTIIGRGEVARPGSPKIKSVKVSGFLPVDSSKVTYTTNRRTKHWKLATSYINFFKNIVSSKKPCRLVVTGAKISLKGYLDFTYGMSSTPNEYTFELNFTEFRDLKPKKAKTRKHKVIKRGKPGTPAIYIPHGSTKLVKSGKSRSIPANKISRGSTVLVNGLAYLTNKATHGVTIRNRKCVITLVSKGAKHPYYVKSSDGVALGWISKGAIR